MVKNVFSVLCGLFFSELGQPLWGQVQRAANPIIHADVPDVSMIRVGDTYYMSSTTMHMSPGVPIMKSMNLTNWELVSCAYDTLADMDELSLVNGKQSYGRGSWASSLRNHDGTYYVSTFAQTTGKTYIFSTTDIEQDRKSTRLNSSHVKISYA